MNDVPAWAWIVAVVFLLIGVSAVAFTFKECGWKTLLLGNGGFYAAALGLCEEK